MSKFLCGAVLDDTFSVLVDSTEHEFLNVLEHLRQDQRQHFLTGQHTHVAAVEVEDFFEFHNWNLNGLQPTGIISVVALVSRNIEIIIRPSIKISNAYCRACGNEVRHTISASI